MSAAAQRRVLDEAGGLRAMTGVLAVMLFLTILAAALGLATRRSTTALEGQLEGRLTVQIIDGNPATRDALAARALTLLRASSIVRRAVPVDRGELARLLAPWLGSDGADPELPMPAMVDVELAPGAPGAPLVAALERLGPAVAVDRHERWMAPVSGFVASLTWLAAGVVLLMLAATAAVVMLAARAGLETHRGTIEVMHMLGSTDGQVAQLFQRRIALDAVIGAIGGGALALAVIWTIGREMAALGSDLVGGAALLRGDWVALAVVPLAFIVLATVAARFTVLAALRRMP